MDSLTPPTPPTDPKPPATPPPPPDATGQAPAAPAEKDAQPDDSQLSPRAWMVRNGTYLMVFAAILVLLYVYFGLAGMWSIFLAALGLSFVIFIHELGHFAVAKWCDVHVETFSIGFGPALPGCSFKWGETRYKIALFPLGGYVKMLGEGDAEEGAEDNPRSYKKKTVGQRMMIISAGVVMNVLLSIICFTAVFFHGKDRDAGVIGNVDPGSEAWTKGVESGAVIDQIGARQASADYRPLYFTDLLSVVLGSAHGDQLPFKGHVYDVGSSQPRTIDIVLEPPPSEEGGRPMIGVGPVSTLDLYKEGQPELTHRPVVHGSAADNVRTVDLRYGDKVVKVTLDDPAKDPKWVTLKNPVTIGEGDQQELAKLWYAEQARGKPLWLTVDRPGEKDAVVVEAKPAAFEFGDRIIAATNPENKESLKGPPDPLPVDPRNPGSGRPDYFAFWRRLKLTTGQFLSVKVQRKDGSEAVLTLPPAYTLTPGFTPAIGPVSAVRDGSIAQKLFKAADLLKENGDVKTGVVLAKVVLKGKKPNGQPDERTFDLVTPGEHFVNPLKLPHLVQDWAYGHENTQVSLVVRSETNEGTGKTGPQDQVLPFEDWKYTDYRFSKEGSGGSSNSVSIPALGIAYRVKGTPVILDQRAKDAGLQSGDHIAKLTYRIRTSDKAVKEDTKELKFPPDPQKTPPKDDGEKWATWFFLLQALLEEEPYLGPSLDEGIEPALDGLLSNPRRVTLELERKVGDKPATVNLTFQPDFDWPMTERGFLLTPDKRVQRADGLWQAIVMGLEDTKNTILDVYYVIRGLVTARLHITKTLGGPLTIGVVAYRSAGMGFWELVYFLALISANLAVINFLPIPFLDGGHMMFLLYEKLRGKPAPESVHTVLTYIGLLLLLLLMATVIILDVWRIWFR